MMQFYRTVRQFSSARSAHDQLIKEFFAALGSDISNNSATAVIEHAADGDSSQDQLFSSLLAQFASRTEKLEKLAELTAATTSIAIRSPSRFAVDRVSRAILDANSAHEISQAIVQLQGVFLPDKKFLQDKSSDSAAQPVPRLLAASIAKCRKFGEPCLAYSLVRQIKHRGMDAYVRWMDANVYNELLYLEWETAGRQDVRRLIALLEEMYREGGVKPNTFTLVLLDKITRELSADCFIKSELRLWAGMLDDISSFGWPISTIEALSKLKVQSI